MSGSLYDPRISALALQDPELAAIERRRALAAALMQQGQQNQKITHPLQIAGNLANTAVGAFMMQKADTEGRDLAQQNKTRDDALLRSVGFNIPGENAPASPMPAGGQPDAPSGAVPSLPAGGATLAVSPEQREMAIALLASRGNPLGTAMLPIVSRQISRQERDTDRKEDREWQREQAQRAQANADRQYALAAQGLAQGNVTWKDETDENGVVIGQRSSRGQFQARQDQGITVPQAQGYVARYAPGYAEGKLSPDQERRFESALSIVTAPKTYFDPSSGQMVTVRPELPRYVAEAVNARRGAAQLSGAAPQAPASTGDTPPALAPQSLPPPAAASQPVPGLPGVSVAQVAPSKTREIDLGTEIATVDQGGNEISRRPKDVAGVASQKAEGAARGTEIAGAESAYRTATQTLQNIDGVLSHPSIRTGTGMSSVANIIPGSGGYDFNMRVDQLKGQAFLQAFNTLKGGGAITEAEGAKATAAIARLNTRLGTADFKAAVQELRDIVAGAQERAKAKMPAPAAAPGGQGAPVAAPSAAAAPGTAPARVRRWNPETGELE